MEKKTLPEKIVSTNRRARHEYHILESFECGLVLHGYEVKSIREGRINIQDAYGTVREDEAFIENMHISPYSHGDLRVIDPLRTRKLPLKLYFKGPRLKLEVGVARGKKLYDKREDMAERDARRDIERAVRGKRKA